MSLARNVYEQLIITLYIEKHSGQASLTDILHRYNEDYSYQRAKCLKYEAQYLSKDKDKIDGYQNTIDEIKTQNNLKSIKDYWWASEKGTSFSKLCKSVIEHNKEMEPLLRLMHLMYKRACLSSHASCMGNRIRLGSDCAGIDMGPWERGQENALFLATASLVYIVSVTYRLLDIEGTDVNKSLNELTIYYHKIIEERVKSRSFVFSYNWQNIYVYSRDSCARLPMQKALIVGEIPMVRAFSIAFKHSCRFMLSTYWDDRGKIRRKKELFIRI